MGEKITGIILSGGKSCRMGQDKGLCMLGDKPMIGYGLEVLESLCDEILISANDSFYEEFHYPVIEDKIRDIGPLGGLMSGISEAKNEHILVLSCDMPFVNTALFLYILEQKENYLAAIPDFRGLIEPTCGYYHKNILNIIEKQIRKQEYSLRKMLQNANYLKVVIEEQMVFYTPSIFSNVNTRTDLEEAAEIAKGFQNKDFWTK
jgi:molybdopterin-guanine dinucleotide biosynthesis protein A